MFLHHFHVHTVLDANIELKEIYLNLLIISFAVSLIDLFIPIFLLHLGYDIIFVLVFYAVFFSFIFISYPLGARISQKIGLKHTIALSLPFLIIFYLLLYSLPNPFVPVLLIAVVYGISKGIYWMPLNTDLVSNVHKVSLGKEFSYTMIAPRLGSIIAPILGAFLVLTLGFHWVFVLAVLLILASIVPLFYSKDFIEIEKEKWVHAFEKKFLKYFFGAFAEGASESFQVIFWPLFIFFLFGGFNDASIYTIGFASSLLVLSSILLSFFVGRLTDSLDARTKRLLVFFGGLFNLVILILAFFSFTSWLVFFVSFFYGVGMTIRTIPFNNALFGKIREKSIQGGLLFRELGLNAGRTIPLLIAALIVFFTGQVFPLIFFFGFGFTAIAVLYFVFQSFDFDSLAA